MHPSDSLAGMRSSIRMDASFFLRRIRMKASLSLPRVFQDQEMVWNFVWLRRIVYFVTLLASFHLAAFCAFHKHVIAHEFESPISLVSQFVRLVESFLPYHVVHWWTDHYATNPEAFLAGVVALAVLIGLGSKLESKITDSMRFIWTQRSQKPTIEHFSFQTIIRDFCTSKPYQGTLRALKYSILPFLSALFLMYFGVVALNHLALNIIDPTGAFCQGTDPSQWEKLADDHKESTKEIVFSTRDVCFATGVYLTRGAKYTVAFVPDGGEKWKDGDLPETTPTGFGSADVAFWKRPIMYAAVPFRRIYFRRWFTVIARIGLVGMNEDYLDPNPDPPKQNSRYTGSTNKLKRDGELFL
jgi:hypothetical protein